MTRYTIRLLFPDIPEIDRPIRNVTLRVDATSREDAIKRLKLKELDEEKYIVSVEPPD